MNRRSYALPALLSLLVLSACSDRSDSQSPQDTPRTVPVVRVEARPLSEGLSAAGRLVSREEAAVVAEVSGYRVARVLVDQGQQVSKGQPLAQLDGGLLEPDIAQQRAAVAQARVAADKAASEAARVVALDGSGVLSAEAIAQRRMAARTANAALEQAQAALAGQLARQSRLVVRAPVSGRILSRSVRPGDVASTATTMFTIGNGNAVELDAEVPEHLMERAQVGEAATVVLANGEAVKGRVRFVSAQLDEQTRLGRVRIALPSRPDLRPGGFASAILGIAGSTVPALPEAALTYGADGASITVVAKDHTVHAQRVRPGRRDGGFVELLAGPPVGTMVLAGGQDFVLDGEKVTPRRFENGGVR